MYLNKKLWKKFAAKEIGSGVLRLLLWFTNCKSQIYQVVRDRVVETQQTNKESRCPSCTKEVERLPLAHKGSESLPLMSISWGRRYRSTSMGMNSVWSNQWEVKLRAQAYGIKGLSVLKTVKHRIQTSLWIGLKNRKCRNFLKSKIQNIKSALEKHRQLQPPARWFRTPPPSPWASLCHST